MTEGDWPLKGSEINWLRWSVAEEPFTAGLLERNFRSEFGDCPAYLSLEPFGADSVDFIHT